MLFRTSIAMFATTAIITLFSPATLLASPAQVVHIDDSVHCDPLMIPTNVDEIGDRAIFPPDEILAHDSTRAFSPVCSAHDDPDLADAVVYITNLTQRDFREVWYVADEETSISNWDGFADDVGVSIPLPFGHESFRIDNKVSDPTGRHHPLLSESLSTDGVWQVGETWGFVLQDYSNKLGASADSFMSIGVGTASLDIAGIMPSSGSIIAVPEPASIVLLASLLFPALTWRRR
ncbi:MAG: PEP-CTERM sorting domain-containing protein [Pirellulaceae bacterium]|nr:PEP-CTERM sorting domain-containing protein [Pirellulaceae bacterium]